MRTGLLGALAAGTCLLWTVNAARAEDHVNWRDSFSTALAEAKTSHKLVMADFYTDW